MAAPWFQFRFTEPADVPEPEPLNLPQLILRSQRKHVPLDLPGERERRRDRVSTSVCGKGRVCSGTPPCPCWDIRVVAPEVVFGEKPGSTTE